MACERKRIKVSATQFSGKLRQFLDRRFDWIALIVITLVTLTILVIF